MQEARFTTKVVDGQELYLTVTSNKDGPFMLSWQDEDHNIVDTLWSKDKAEWDNKAYLQAIARLRTQYAISTALANIFSQRHST